MILLFWDLLAQIAPYSIFDSGLYGNLDAEWRFSQENATLHDLKMATRESKML